MGPDISSYYITSGIAIGIYDFPEWPEAYAFIL